MACDWCMMMYDDVFCEMCVLFICVYDIMFSMICNLSNVYDPNGVFGLYVRILGICVCTCMYMYVTVWARRSRHCGRVVKAID